MITNERQYKIAKAELRKFEEAIAVERSRDPSLGVAPAIHTAMGDAMKSETKVLSKQLKAYEDLKSGKVKGRSLRSLRELPAALIEARIAANVTQKVLAQRLGVAEQQIQRLEATNYTGVSLERLQDVIEALKIDVSEKISYIPKKEHHKKAA